MYTSSIIIDKIAEQILEHQDDMVLAYIQTIGIRIDKDELVKALRYDRNQYNEGYADCFRDMTKRRKIALWKKHLT